jgi:hypothetical protein
MKSHSCLRAVCIIEVEALLATPGTSPEDVAHAIGNAMSINVLYRVLSRALLAAGLIKEKPKDIWKHLTSGQVRRARVLPDDMYAAKSTWLALSR